MGSWLWVVWDRAGCGIASVPEKDQTQTHFLRRQDGNSRLRGDGDMVVMMLGLFLSLQRASNGLKKKEEKRRLTLMTHNTKGA